MGAAKSDSNQIHLFDPYRPPGKLPSRSIRALFIRKLVAEEATRVRQAYAGAVDGASGIMAKWADFETQGRLFGKETSLDADFLHDVFGRALGYRLFANGEATYELERQFPVPGVGTVDAAIGQFSPTSDKRPVAIIELKSADADLDLDKFNGRTPVQQCWDYLNALPECKWGIVSNFVTIRLYHRTSGSLAYQEFTLLDLRNPDRLADFFCCLGRGALLPTKLDPTPRAEALLKRSAERQREIGDELYAVYSRHRLELILHLRSEHEYDVDRAIAIAQKILDRIIFIAFCEDRGLLPGRIIERAYREVPPLARVTNPRWRNFLDLFHAVDSGHSSLVTQQG